MKERILINVSGIDKPGVTSEITTVLAAYDINVLDIGQAVIHSRFSLAVLVEIPAGVDSSPILKDVLYRSHELDFIVSFSPVTKDSYTEWFDNQAKPRHIITLIARNITAAQISKLTMIIAKEGLNIDKINRLSGQVPLGDIASSSSACIEFLVRGELQDKNRVRSDFLELSNQIDVDIAYQEDNAYRRSRRLVAFDMDSTLIDVEVIDELAKRAGVGEQVIAITEQAMRGELDFKQSFTKRVALLKGLDEAVLQDIAKNLNLSEGAEKLISTLKKFGYKTAILSGGFTYFANHLAVKLGIDYVYANELHIVDGKVTGQVLTEVVDGRRKASLLKEIAEKEQLSLEQVIAVGDGANDLPMLNLAGMGIAFRAKPIVKQSAQHAISALGLDAILYLIGFSDREIMP